LVKIRLQRRGRKKKPYYHIVAADSRSPRDGRIIEDLGRFNPVIHPNLVQLDVDRAVYWIKNGAKASDSVRSLLKEEGVYYRVHLERWGKSQEEIDEIISSWKEDKSADGTTTRTLKEQKRAALEEEEKVYQKQQEELAKKEAEERAKKAKAKAEAEAKAKAEEEAKAKAEAEKAKAEKAEAEAEAEKAEEETEKKEEKTEAKAKADEEAKAEAEPADEGDEAKAEAKDEAEEKASDDSKKEEK